MTTIDIEEACYFVEGILSNEITGEYPWLDFKLEYKNNPEELVHDVLCLSNVRHSGSRYLIYGVQDGTWSLKGISKELVSNDIYAILNSQV